MPNRSRIPFPLTPVQAGMIYESALAGRASVNLEQIVVQMGAAESIDAADMQAAWVALAAQHPALRLVVDLAHPDGPRQQVRDEVRFDFAIRTIGTALPDSALFHADQGGATDRAATDPAPSALTEDPDLAAFLAEDRARGGDMAAWPNWRLTLLQRDHGPDTLVWSFPHSLLDGRSFSILLEEVFTRYEALRHGTPGPEATDRPDFALHCLAMADPVDPSTLAHFMDHLDGFKGANELGLGLPAEAPPGTVKPTLATQLTRTATRALAERAGRAGTTLASALNAAWGLVLARSSGQALAVFGVTRSGRQFLPRSEEMVGCLINTVPLCVRIDPAMTLDRLLRQVRSDQFAMRPHEHCGLSEIRAGLGLAADRPLFDSMVVYEHDTLASRMQGRGGAWRDRRVSLHEEGALPLTLAAYGESELRLRLEYDPARLSPEAAARHLAALEQVLLAMAEAGEDAPLSSLRMLPEAEVTALTRLAQGPPSRIAPVADVAAAVAAMAAAQPEAPAVIDPGRGKVISFAELDARAERMARALMRQGAGPGRIIALCLPRSPAYVAALLAVLKTGAAFLPLDPAYPSESLDFMAADSGALLLLTDHIAPWMTGHPALELAELEQEEPQAEDAGDLTPRPEIAADPTRPAYMIYTSGTTGRPKGVVVPVAALAAHIAAAQDLFGLTPQDRVLQFTALSFDVSIEELLPSLTAGATVVLRPEAAGRDPRLLLDVVAAEGVTVLNLPTGFWQVLAEDMDMSGARLPDCMRLVITGGERVPPAALDRWRRLVPGLPWINGYGPTETTITAAAFALPAATRLPAGEIPVGRPLAHARAYVMAADGSPAPRGAPGELWIGGPCVANLYHDRPELTAERFVPDPFRPGARAYRSGDVARWAADGQLMLEGRNDRQVKLRGFRIEPAEIERILESLPGVGQALVAVIDAETPNARLMAWVRPAVAGRQLDVRALAAAAGALMPPQMRPQLVALPDWPLRPGGKIDMARLPRPDAPAPREDSEEGPQDAVMRALAALFADLLTSDPRQNGGQAAVQIGPDASFFDLGGHSLLLIRLIGRIEARFGRRLSVAEIHADPTPRGLARLLGQSATPHRPLDDCLVPIQPHGHQPPIFGVHVLGVNGSFYRPLARHLGPDQPIFGLTVGLLDETTPTGVEETAELYRRVIEARYPRGPLSLVAVSLGAYVALELAQRLLAQGRDVTMLAMLDAAGPGGRPRIGVLARGGAHLRLLLREGPRHLQRQVENKLSDLQHWFEKLKLVLAGRHGRAVSPTSSIEQFVAANELAVLAYRPRPYPRRLTIIRAASSVFDSDEAIASGLGWSRIAAGGFDLREVDGDHLTILEEPAVDELARLLAEAIRRGSNA